MGEEVCYVLVGKESSWGAYKGKRVKRIFGSPGSVEFDWEWVLGREEKHGDVLGFWHTHPAGTKPSERDVLTMKAWASCLGKSLFCIIQDGKDTRAYLYPESIYSEWWEKVLRVKNFFNRFKVSFL